jgi:hypothetical protein
VRVDVADRGDAHCPVDRGSLERKPRRCRKVMNAGCGDARRSGGGLRSSAPCGGVRVVLGVVVGVGTGTRAGSDRDRAQRFGPVGARRWR